MRQLVLAGVFRNAQLIKLAVRCAWCRRFASGADYVAAHKYNRPVSDGMCRSCADKMERDPNYRGVGSTPAA